MSEECPTCFGVGWYNVDKSNGIVCAKHCWRCGGTGVVDREGKVGGQGESMTAEQKYINELKLERDEYKAALLNKMQSHCGRLCPFCYGERYVSDAKAQVRQRLVQQWHEHLTYEEIEADYKRKQEDMVSAAGAVPAAVEA